ncbi:spondin domain-containing protein [Actibacterium sp. 188UL27-1]|uniref:spondin domain-containing protein n=1 Tax=Actibacterium sp. 188UL27-1 TaxID=2786961 RepID=UPI00195A8CF5|nr:spondin domain-containing protein [Actibacterium sp. 188UL27-1]MBM7068163.1 VPLPA-CTERM sorting domain-containing protein [Actibacterium sp. 188UL27-1]
MTTLTRLTCGVAAGLISLCAGAAMAASVQITITNNQTEQGLYLTPLFTTLHDGSFDTFNPDDTASQALEDLAEEGSVGGLVAQAEAGGFRTGILANANGFGGAPVLDPGETATFTFDNVNTGTERFLSFAAMVIPSNDAFIGNPEGIEIFDANGNFTGLGPIELSFANVWDGGTEENDGQGAAFNPTGGTSTDTSEGVALLDSLAFLDGQPTADGTTVDFSQTGTSLATIEIAVVPLPAALPLLLAGLGGLTVLGRRRRT